MASDKEMDEIIDVRPTGAGTKPTMRVDAATLRNSRVVNTLPEFLSQLARANRQLETDLARRDKASGFELDDSSAAQQPHIEMNLYTGVVQEQPSQRQPKGANIKIPKASTKPTPTNASDASSSSDAESTTSSSSPSSSSSSQRRRIILKRRKRSSAAAASPGTPDPSFPAHTRLVSPKSSTSLPGGSDGDESSISSMEGRSHDAKGSPSARRIKVKSPKRRQASSQKATDSGSPSSSGSSSTSVEDRQINLLKKRPSGREKSTAARSKKAKLIEEVD